MKATKAAKISLVSTWPELKNIYRDIKKESKKGNVSIPVDTISINDKIINQLKIDGYEIQVYPDQTLISWH